MKQEIKELMEWAHNRMPLFDCHSCKYTAQCTCPTADEGTCIKAMETIKIILSHPDLALIDKHFLWKIKAMLRGMQIKQQSDPSIVWKTSLDVALEEFDDMIIPLAEAIKEVNYETN